MSECLWNPIDFHPRLNSDWFHLFPQFDFFLPGSTIACSFFLAAAQTSFQALFSSPHLSVRLLFRWAIYPRASFKLQPGDLSCQQCFPFFSFLHILGKAREITFAQNKCKRFLYKTTPPCRLVLRLRIQGQDSRTVSNWAELCLETVAPEKD